jgi:hypothetical protein
LRQDDRIGCSDDALPVNVDKLAAKLNIPFITNTFILPDKLILWHAECLINQWQARMKRDHAANSSLSASLPLRQPPSEPPHQAIIPFKNPVNRRVLLLLGAF